MKVLALDFDGVLFDSVREALVVALRVYLEQSPSSRLRQGANRIESRLGPQGPDLLDDDLARRFVALTPLGNRAEDFGVSLAAIDRGLELPDQDAYDAWYASLEPAWLTRFHRRFYEVRAAFAADEQRWLDLQPPYPGVPELLRRHAAEVSLAVATAKDHASVRRVLAHHGMLDLFGDDLVLDKETGVSKTAHLELIRHRAAVSFPDITFVDDKLNHLEAVAHLGVRPVLAGWGYNGERERAVARSRGFLVCSLEDVERRLFT